MVKWADVFLIFCIFMDFPKLYMFCFLMYKINLEYLRNQMYH